MGNSTNKHKAGSDKLKDDQHDVFEKSSHIKHKTFKIKDQYQFILEATGTGIWEWNVQSGETIFNEKWANIVGYTLEELQPVSIETWTRLTHPDDLHYAQEALQKHFAGLAPFYEAEFRMKHREGHWVWILDKGKVAEWTPDGKALWMLGTHQDINERKKAEHLANERMKELNAFYKLSELTENKHLSIDEIYSQFINFLPSSLQHSHLAYAKLNIEEKEYYSDNYLQSTPWNIAAPILIGGLVLGALEIGYNPGIPDEPDTFMNEENLLLEGIAKRLARFNERKKAEDQLRFSENRFRNLVNQMQLGLAVHEIILDKKGKPVNYRFLDVNPAFEHLTGLKRESIIGKTVLEVLPHTESEWIKTYGNVALTGQSVSFERYSKELDKYYQVVAYQTQTLQFAVLTEDVTLQKLNIRQLESNNQKFRLLNQAATEMLSLKTPNEIYRYITESLHNQYPDSVILFLLVDEERKTSKLIELKGVNKQIIANTKKITGFNFMEMEFKLIPELFNHFKTGKLFKFDNGLAAFTGKEFPKLAAKTIEKMLGIKQIYTVGINKDERLYATIHFFNRGKEIADHEYIETFVKQAGIVIDRARTAELLAQSEEKYRIITENASDVIWVLNVKQQKFTYISPAIEQLRGFTVEEAINQSLEESMTHESMLRVQNALKENLEKFLSHTLTVEYYINEIQQPCKDGSLIWVEVSTKFRFNKHGEIEVVGVSRNIEERKKTEEQLIKLSRVAEQNPTNIVITDLRGNIEYVNPKFTEITGYSFDEAIGKNPRMLKSGHTTPEEYKNLWKTINAGNEWEGIFKNKKKDDSLYWEKARISPVKNQQGKTINYLAIKEDITEQVKARDALIESETKLKEALLTKDKFFSIISHDLRSPVSSLLSFTGLLSDEQSRFTLDEYKHYNRAIHKSVQTIFNLLENLLEWSILQQEKVKFQPKDTLLGQFMEKLNEQVLEITQQKNIKLTMKYPADLHFKADNNMLNSIFRNLISNAVKFTPEGGTVNLEVSSTDPSFILFKVQDTGIGMDAELVGKLFRIDEKVNRPGTNNEPSSGLGLILCKEFVELHGGKIWVESQEGRGSTFYFTIPIKIG